MGIKKQIVRLYWKVSGKIKYYRYHAGKYFSALGNWRRGIFTGRKLKAAVHSRCVVICAHPDDETIFFSSILKREKPFVVCVSHRGNRVRSQEFYQALEHWGVEGVMLNMPDVPGMKWAWKACMAGKLRRIRKKLPDVTTVYTHSGHGESGHPHHYAVHRAVAKTFADCKLYTTASQMPDNGLVALSDDAVREKYEVVSGCYGSQIKMLETWCPWWKIYLNSEFFEE